MSPPLALTDAQLDQVLAYAQPLDPEDRGKFLTEVAQKLNGHEVGDGILARVCADVQARYQSRPQESEQDDKWSFCLTAGTLCPANQEKQ